VASVWCNRHTCDACACGTGDGEGTALPHRTQIRRRDRQNPDSKSQHGPALHMFCVSPALGAAVVQWTLRHTCATAHAITWSAMNNTEHMHHGPYPMQHGDGLDVAFGPYPTYRAVRCGVVAGSYRAGKSWYGMSRCVELVRCRVRTQRAHAARTCAGPSCYRKAVHCCHKARGL